MTTMSPGIALITLARAHRYWFGERLAELGLHVGQELLLQALAEEGPSVLQSQLTARLGVERATTSKALARLERDGYVTRDRPGRGGHVRLTEDGIRLIPAIDELWSQSDRLLERALGSQTTAFTRAMHDATESFRNAKKAPAT